MSDRPKAPPVPAPRPKAKNRARHAMAHVVTKGLTKVEVDGVPMTVEQSGNAKSLEFAAQVEEPNGRKVKIAGQVSYFDPAEPRLQGVPFAAVQRVARWRRPYMSLVLLEAFGRYEQ